MSRLTSVSLIALTSLSLALADCGKKAEGQVVAVVNGEEITLNELNGEIAELNIPANVDKIRVRAEVLQRMVERRCWRSPPRMPVLTATRPTSARSGG